jgi:hypothetical protein
MPLAPPKEGATAGIALVGKRHGGYEARADTDIGLARDRQVIEVRAMHRPRF